MGPKLLLIGWDAADWKVINPLIERAQMPALTSLIEHGVMGDIETLQPVLSPMLWNSIATGKRADEHGILGFTEVDPETQTVRPVTSTSRRVKALWNIFSQQGLRTNVAGWFGGHPAEPVRGACVSDAYYARGFPRDGDPWPLMPGTVWPERLSEALAELRLRPSEIDGDIIRMFVDRAAEIDYSKPHLIHALVNVLAECFTTHAAATHLMEHEPWDFMAVYYIGIDHFSHSFMNFHPPRESWVAEADFEMYKDVVNSGYRLMDLFLARLLHLAGPDTSVVLLSDHGFHSDHLRPMSIPDIPAGPAAPHRQMGIVTMAGPGILRDERIYGVTLLDIAPTVLSLFGLPAGQDMPGRVLAEAFETPPALNRIPSWEAVPGDSGMHSAGYTMPPSDAELLLRQFVDLGYVEEPRNDPMAAVDCERERQWNLARVYTSSLRFAEALPILETIHAQAPERGDYALALAEAQRRVGLTDDAAATVERAIAGHRDTPAAHMILDNVAYEHGRLREAVQELLIAGEGDSRLPDLQTSLGFAWLGQRKWRPAEEAFRKAIGMDPHSAASWQGLAFALLKQARLEPAVDAALTSVGYPHGSPQAHFVLGMALLRLGRRDRAIQAFETCLALRPPLQAAHRVLARVHPDPARAAAREEAAPAEARPDPGPPLDLVVVSGLPRSGTSLMMQMLAAAGIPVLTDGERAADSDNPEGYYDGSESSRWAAARRFCARPPAKPSGDRAAVGAVARAPSL